MVILTPGNSATMTLTDYDSVTVQTRGVVTIEAISGLGVAAGVIAQISGSRTFGPYSAGQIKLTASAADVLYDVQDGADNGTKPYNPAAVATSLLSLRLAQSAATAKGANPFDLAVMASPPTITEGGAVPSPGRTVGYWTSTNDRANFNVLGLGAEVFKSQYATNYLRGASARTAVATYQNAASGFVVEYTTDAPLIKQEFLNSSTLPIFISVNGAFTSASGHTTVAQNGAISIDFGGVRAIRTLRFYFQQDHGFGRVTIGADDVLYAPAISRPKMLVIGDSYIAGTLSPSGPIVKSLTGVLREVSGCDVIGHGVGGSGYVNGVALTNSFRLDDAAAVAPDLITIALGINDLGLSGIQSAALSSLQGLRSRLPNTPIVVFGPWPGSNNLSANLLAADAAISQAVASMGDSRILFESTVTASPTVSPWSFGTKDADTATGTAGPSLYITGNDGTHPSIYGAEYLARRKLAATVSNLARMSL